MTDQKGNEKREVSIGTCIFTIAIYWFKRARVYNCKSFILSALIIVRLARELANSLNVSDFDETCGLVNMCYKVTTAFYVAFLS